MAGAVNAADDEVLAAEARGNPAAFAVLYERYQPEILRFVMGKVSDPEQAEDITSQVFLRAMRGMATYEAGSFRGWLYQIARNAVVDVYRRPSPVVDTEHLGRLADPVPGPDAVVESQEAADALRAILGQLTEGQRQIITLRLSGATGQEIADALGMTLGAVKSAQFRAFERIRALMRRSDDDAGHGPSRKEDWLP